MLTGDGKNLKVKSRRDPDQDCSRSFKKGKTDGMLSTNDEWILDHSGTTSKVGNGFDSNNPTTSVTKDQGKHKDSSSSRDSKCNGKDRLQVSVEKAKDKVQGEGSQDLRNYDAVNIVKKRKMKEHQNTQTCGTGNHLKESRVSVQDDFIASRKEKKARVSKSEGRESSTSKGSGRVDKKISQKESQKLRLEPGSSQSQRSLDGIDYLKRDLESVHATAAATSSSSKISGSHKTKAGFQEVKGSPVESVSSSPVRIINTDKFASMGKDDSQDTGAVGSPRRCPNAEDDGGGDQFGTARRNKSLAMDHSRSHGSSKLDLLDKDVNHISNSKFKAQPLSPDVDTSPFTNGGVDPVGQDGTYPDQESIKDQCQSEERTDVYSANASFPRKTGRGSCLKDNSESCKSESKAEKVMNSGSLGQLQDQSPLSEAKPGDKVKLQEKVGFKSDKSENMYSGKEDVTENGSRRKENHSNRGHGFQEVSVDAIKQEALSTPSQNHFLDSDAERSSKRSLSERTDQEILGKGKSPSLPPSGGAQIEAVGRGPQPVTGFHKGSGDMAADRSKDDASKLQKKQIRKADHQNGIQQSGSRHPTLNGHRSKEPDAPSPIRRDSSSHAANNAVKEAKDLKHLADRLKVFYIQCLLEFGVFCFYWPLI